MIGRDLDPGLFLERNAETAEAEEKQDSGGPAWARRPEIDGEGARARAPVQGFSYQPLFSSGISPSCFSAISGGTASRVPSGFCTTTPFLVRSL